MMLGKGKEISVRGFVKDSMDKLAEEVNEWLQEEGKELSVQDIQYSNAGISGGQLYSVLVIISNDTR